MFWQRKKLIQTKLNVPCKYGACTFNPSPTNLTTNERKKETGYMVQGFQVSLCTKFLK